MDTREAVSNLDEHDRRVLAFAAQWWPAPGLLHQAIVIEFGITPQAYFQRLNRLIDEESALMLSPTLVGRLRRLRQRTGAGDRVGVANGG